MSLLKTSRSRAELLVGGGNPIGPSIDQLEDSYPGRRQRAGRQSKVLKLIGVGPTEKVLDFRLTPTWLSGHGGVEGMWRPSTPPTNPLAPARPGRAASCSTAQDVVALAHWLAKTSVVAPGARGHHDAVAADSPR